MPDSSRSQRRRNQRGSGSGPTTPGKSDPMRMIYIGAALVVMLFVAALGFMRWQQNNALQAAYATPSPLPSASGAPTPIPLIDGTAIGKAMIQTGKTVTDTSRGGVGQPVDGIPCAAQEYVTLHVHPHLSIFYHGTQVQVPRFIGGAPSPGGGCLYWVHTHDASGIIHVEAPQLAPPGGSDYNLGILFDIWGQSLTRNNVAGLKGPVTAYVNGQKYNGDLRSIPLKSHNEITLEVGSPLVPPPNYSFPPNE